MSYNLEIENVVIVSSLIPPDHSGARKRMFNFFKHLRNETEFNVCTISHTNNNEEGVKCINSYYSNGIMNKLSLIITFIHALIILPFVLKSLGFKSRKSALWLTSTTPLTFAASIWGYIFGFKTITQNTLFGSDDPGHKYPGDLFSLKYRLKGLQYRLSDKVTSISPLLYENTIKYHPNVKMIPNPVDLKKFKNKTNITKRRLNKNVLIVGGIGYRKGSDIVLKTIKEVHKVEPEVKFIFVGPNNDLQIILEKENLSLKEYKNVDFIGYVLNPSKYFKEASLFFLPSRREGFGIVFIEAMAAGLPVVAKKIDGITNFIFGDEAKTIYDTESPVLYAEMILRLLNNDDMYKKEVENNLKKVLRFKDKVIYNKYIKLIID